MAMFPNATKGYMPFVPSRQNAGKSHKRSRHVSKPHNVHKSTTMSENKHSLPQKMYQITLKDKKGVTYKYIVKTDGTKSLPELCESKISLKSTSSSLPNLGFTFNSGSPNSPRRILGSKHDTGDNVDFNSQECISTSLDLRECGKKEGLFSSFIRFLKEKTGKSDKQSKSGKSKRKPKPNVQRKRQRTVSAMSNLDPIKESPLEHEYEDDADADSYTHYGSSTLSTDSDTSSVDSAISNDSESNAENGS